MDARLPAYDETKARSIDLFRRQLPADTAYLNWGCAKRAGEPVA